MYLFIWCTFNFVCKALRNFVYYALNKCYLLFIIISLLCKHTTELLIHAVQWPFRSFLVLCTQVFDIGPNWVWLLLQEWLKIFALVFNAGLAKIFCHIFSFISKCFPVRRPPSIFFAFLYRFFFFLHCLWRLELNQGKLYLVNDILEGIYLSMIKVRFFCIWTHTSNSWTKK